MENVEVVKLLFRMGTASKLPRLDEGEPGFTTDTGRVFIGSATGNIELAKKSEVAQNITDITEMFNTLEPRVTSTEGSLSTLNSALTDHTSNSSNPHGVTKAQVGLGNVDNIQQASKTEFDSHTGNTSNPHGVTKAQVGLGSVANYGVATQAEATTGTSNTKYMTPLRTKEAIEALAMVTDQATGTKYKWGIENGLVYVEEV